MSVRIVAIKGFSDYYIADDGRVFSTKKGNRRELKRRLTNDGYNYVTLFKNRMQYQRLCHRLVALHFVRKPKPKSKSSSSGAATSNKRYFVMHKNGIRTDDHYTNLRWASRLTINRYKGRVLNRQPRGAQLCHHKLNEAAVRRIRSKNESAKKLAKRYGVAIGTISAVRARRIWRHVTP